MTYSITEIAATLRSWGVNSVRQMEQITTELLVNMPTSPVIAGGGSNQEGAGDPTSSTPDFEGQYYEDTDTGNLWKSNSTTTGDWDLALQDAKMEWLPKSVVATGIIGSFSFFNTPGITSVTYKHEEMLNGVDLELMDDLESLSFPHLVSIDPDSTNSGYLQCSDCQLLGSITFPSLEFIAAQFNVSANSSLTSVSLPALTTVGEFFRCRSNPLMTRISIPLFIPTNGKNVDCSGCALTQDSVDHVLSRCVANAGYVSGTVTLNGGTNSAPSGTGALMVVELQGRGVTVNTN